MKKRYVLKNKLQFNNVIKKGKKVKNENFVIYFLPDLELKLGIAIGKKMGKAHLRNYHKRVIRVIVQKNIDNIPSANYVIVGRENLKNISFDQKKASFEGLIEKVKQR